MSMTPWDNINRGLTYKGLPVDVPDGPRVSADDITTWDVERWADCARSAGRVEPYLGAHRRAYENLIREACDADARTIRTKEARA